MARPQRITACAITITTHPTHSAQGYAQLWMDAFRLRKAIAVRGDAHLMIGSAKPEDPAHETSEITGTIFRFTEIDLGGTWFNLQRMDEAKPSEVAEIKIPEKLRPNCKRFFYLFDPKTHRLVVNCEAEGGSQDSTVRPATIQKFVELLMAEPPIEKAHGVVEATVLPVRESVERALGIAQLRKLTIFLKRPNPDGPADLCAKILKGMEEEGVQRKTIESTAMPGGTIQPNEETRQLAEVARVHGHVVASGMDAANETVQVDTREHPQIERDTIAPGRMTRLAAFLQLARRAFNRG